MSCYFRHLQEIFTEAGIIVTSANRKELDEAFHSIVGAQYKECPATWKALKQEWLVNPDKRQQLVKELHNVVK